MLALQLIAVRFLALVEHFSASPASAERQLVPVRLGSNTYARSSRSRSSLVPPSLKRFLRAARVERERVNAASMATPQKAC